MKITEASIMRGKKITIDESELAAIIKANPTASLDMSDVEAKRLFAFEARVIDSNPTLNKRAYSRQWQDKVLPQWSNGVRLVWDENSHTPDDRSDYGWTYSGRLDESDGTTSTIVRVAIPVMDSTRELTDRLRMGLSKGLSLSAEISKEGAKQRADGITEITADGESRLLHLAITTSPASSAATVLATSESIHVEETTEPKPERTLSERETMLLQEAEKIRAPMIQEAIKYARLLNPKLEPEQLTERLNRWTVEEIAIYKDAHKTMYEKANPNANKQFSKAVPVSEPSGGIRTTEQPTSTQWKSLDEIMRDVKPINQ